MTHLTFLYMIYSLFQVWADCKPGNFLLVKDANAMMPRLVACDFSTAMTVGDKIDPSGMATPQYAPPERIWAVTSGGGGNLTAQASFDIWSFGLCLYRILTGSEFFSSDGEALEIFGKDKSNGGKVEEFIENRVNWVRNSRVIRTNWF